MNGTDGLEMRLQNIHDPFRLFQKCHSGGGSVMLCGSFAEPKESQLFFCELVTGDCYRQMLRGTFLFFAEDLPTGWSFMHDGASIHCCRIVQN